MEEIKQVLEEYGLSKNEINVYLNCLKLGVCSVYKLSEKTSLPKSTCYDTLKTLKQKGLVSSIIKDKKKHFEVADPEKMVGVLEEKKTKIENIIPALQEMKKTTVEKPQVKVFSGKEGIKTIFESVLATNKDFLILGNFDKFNDYLPFYSDLFVKRRVKQKLVCKLIEEKSKDNLKLKKGDQKELRETKFLKSLERMDSECFIFGDKIALITLTKEEPVSILVENKEIAKLFRLVFNEMWD